MNKDKCDKCVRYTAVIFTPKDDYCNRCYRKCEKDKPVKEKKGQGWTGRLLTDLV